MAGSRSVAAELAAWMTASGWVCLTSAANGAKRRELLAQERVADLVGGGEMGHSAGHGQARRRVDRGHDAAGDGDVARAQPAHAAVQLDVHPQRPAGQRGHEAFVPGDDVGVGLDGDVDLGPRQRAHDQQPPLDPRRAQGRCLAGRGHGQPGRAALPRRRRARRGAVPVAVGLDHRA